VVGAAALKRIGWRRGAVIASVIALVALAFHGRRPDPGLVPFEAAGVMPDLTPERVREVRLLSGEQTWRFLRRPDGAWRRIAPVPTADADPSRAVENGLRFLHVSAPQRVMSRDEFDGTPLREYGLDPPRYEVTVSDAEGASFTIHFGWANTQGLAQYARVADRDELVLLPRFTSEPWEALLASP
jgi:Domain of unknown function (DUF4340)